MTSGREVRIWCVLALCCWVLTMLAACGRPALAGGGRQQVTRHGGQMAWPEQYFVPYVNGETNLVELSRASGARFFTLAFIERSRNHRCRATWNTRQPIGSWMHASIEALRARGGDVRVAFGGSANGELAAACKALPELEAQYQAVIDVYNLTHLDFDIEGKTLSNARANARRNQAIAALQQRAAQAGKQLNISYTLPVETTGLTWSGLNLLRDAARNGVQIGAVNLMTMDYFSKHAPGARMGLNAIAAAISVFHQLQQIYPAQSAGQIWGMLGLTPMIGVNDNPAEVFTLQDAQTVIGFARQQQMPLLAFWSLERDRACASDQTAPHGCSGVDQQPYGYTQIFAAFGTGQPTPAAPSAAAQSPR